MNERGYLPRIIDGTLESSLGAAPIVLLDGPRGAGKTTSAERLATSILRLPQDLALLEVDPERTLRRLAAPILIDEWQLAGPDLLWTLKQVVDADPTPGRFLLTGSVEPATHGPTYPLTGRAISLTMHPMTRAEVVGRGDQPTFLGRLASGEQPQPSAGQKSSFAIDQLFRTGFPAARHQDDPSMFLYSYASLVSQRAGEEGRDATRLFKTLSVLGVLTAQAVPDQRIWDSADINKATWKAYEDLLTRVHLATPLPAYTSNALKRLTSYPRRLLTDTALALAVAQLTGDDLQRDLALVGRFIESFAAQQLRPQVEVLNGRLWHVRTSGGDHEIDLLAEVGPRRFAFEVKAGTRPTFDDTRHLRWLAREVGDDLDLSFVLHTGGDTYPLADRIWAVPLASL